MVKKAYVHCYMMIIGAFSIANVTASDKQHYISFVSTQNRDGMGSSIASIVNEYIGSERELQSIDYCLQQKSFSLVEDESHALGKGHLQLPPRIKWFLSSLGIEYAKEVPPTTVCFGPSMPDSSQPTPPRTVLRALYVIGELHAIKKLEDRSKIEVQPLTDDTTYHPRDKDSLELHLDDKDSAIKNMRRLFGSEIVTSSLTGSNGDIAFLAPHHILTCQNEKINIFEIRNKSIPVFEYHRRVNKFFQRYLKLNTHMKK